MPLPTFKSGGFADTKAAKSRFKDFTIGPATKQMLGEREDVRQSRISDLKKATKGLEETSMFNLFGKAKKSIDVLMARRKLEKPIDDNAIELRRRENIAKAEEINIEQRLDQQYAFDRDANERIKIAMENGAGVTARSFAPPETSPTGQGGTVFSPQDLEPVRYLPVPTKEESDRFAKQQAGELADDVVLQNLIARRLDPRVPEPTFGQRAKQTGGVAASALTLGAIREDSRDPLVQRAEQAVFPKGQAQEVGEMGIRIGGMFVPYVGLEYGAVKVGRALRKAGAVDDMFNAYPHLADLGTRNMGVAAGEAAIMAGSGQDYTAKDFMMNIAFQGVFDTAFFSGAKSRVMSHLDNEVFNMRRSLGRKPTEAEVLEAVADVNVPGFDFTYGSWFAENRLLYKSGIDPTTGVPPEGRPGIERPAALPEGRRVVSQATGNPDEIVRGLRVEKMNSVEAQQTLRDVLQKHPDILNSRTRGVVSNAQTVEEANRRRVGKEDILSWPEGTVKNAADATAARQFATAHARDTEILRKMAEVEKRAGDDTAIQKQYTEAFLEDAEIQARVKALGTELGRGTQSFAISVDPISNLRKKFDNFMAKQDEKTRAAMASDAMGVDPTNQKEVDKFIDRWTKSTWWGIAREVGVSSKLWRAGTQIVNLTGNSLQSVARPTFTAFTAGGDVVRVGTGKMFGRNSQREVFFGDALYDIKGQFFGFKSGKQAIESGVGKGFRIPVKEMTRRLAKYRPYATTKQAESEGFWNATWAGLGEGWRALIDEQYIIPQSVVEDTRGHRAVQIKGRPGKHTAGDKILDVTGKVVRTPFRALNVGDVALRSVNTSGGLGQLAHRQAAKEGLRGQALHKRAVELMTDPPPEMAEAAFKIGERAVFQEPMGVLTKKIQEIRNVPGWGDAIAITAIPFLKTGVNLIKRGVDMTLPIPNLKKIKMGGPQATSEEIARITLVSLTAMGVNKLAMDGYITGAPPPDKKLREELYAAGWQPYSLRIGDKYYSYDRIDPFSQVFRTHAAIADAYRETGEMNQEMIGTSMTNWLQYTADRTYISGIHQTLDAVFNPDTSGQQWINRFAFGNVPFSGLSTDITQLTDVNEEGDVILRDPPDNLTEYFKANFPLTAGDRPQRFDSSGRPITLPQSGVERVLSPVRSSATELSVAETNAMVEEYNEIKRIGEDVRDEVDLARDEAMIWMEDHKEVPKDIAKTNLKWELRNRPEVGEQIVKILKSKDKMEFIDEVVKGKTIEIRAKWMENKMSEMSKADKKAFFKDKALQGILTKDVAEEMGLEVGADFWKTINTIRRQLK